jgi:pimeloyl-ACP methyl ester carboxylesterase
MRQNQGPTLRAPRYPGRPDRGAIARRKRTRYDRAMGPGIDQWRAQGHFVAFGTQRIFCVDSAPGDHERDALILIHGFPTASWDFAKVWPALAQRFRVIAADLLGFGFSSKPRHHTYSIFEQADVVEAVLADCRVARFHILAHDYGDTVAQELLARDNARPNAAIRSVCLLNGGLFPETHRPRAVQRLLRSPLGFAVSRLIGRRAFERSLAAVFGPDTPPSAEDLDAFWRLLTHEDGQHLAHKLIHYIGDRIANRERWVDALREARCPLALIDGAADPVSGAHMVARYRELIGKGHVVELARIGHYPQVEAPQLVLRHYAEFLAAAPE